MHGNRWAWIRALLGLLGFCVLIVVTEPSLADDVVIPLRTQANLITKVAGYDRSLVARPGPRQILIVRSKTTVSRRVADGIAAELRSFNAIAGAPHQEHTLEFSSVQSLRQRVNSQAIQIVYLCPGLEDQLAAIAAGLAGLTVLSIGAGPDYADLGAVIAFDMHSGRTQLLVNLKQAQKQNVQLHAEFLKIAKVIR